MARMSEHADDARIDLDVLVGAVLRRLPRMVLVTMVCLAVTFVILMFMPRLYESSASILVEPRSNAYIRVSPDQSIALPSNENGGVSSQIQLIKSRDTLLRVVDQLDLRSKAEFNGAGANTSLVGQLMAMAGRNSPRDSVDETVLSTLYDRLSVVQERDSRIITVSVRSTDPQLAADIANAVAYAHVNRRAQLSVSDTQDASTWLGDEIARLRNSVQAAETAVADFKVDNDLYTSQNNSSLLDQQLTTLSSQIAAAQERRNTAQSRASLVRGLIERGQAIENVAEVRDSPSVQRLSEDKARLQAELAQRSATLLDNHPTMRALRAQIGETDRQIRTESGRVAAGLEAQAQLEDELVASLQAQLDTAKASASTATRDTVTLDGLEREAKAQRDLLEAYLLRYTEASSRNDASAQLPDVRVVTEAAPSVTPASPKTSMIMMAVAFISFFGQLGLVVFSELMSGRAMAPVARHDAEVVESEEDLTPPPAARAAVAEKPAVADDYAENLASLDEVRSSLTAILAEPSDEEVSQPEPEAAPAPAVSSVEDDLIPVRAVSLDHGNDEALYPKPQPGLVRYEELVADLVLGRTNLLLLAEHGSASVEESMAQILVNDARSKGLSIAVVDAGSAKPSTHPGLSDLSHGEARFGDVVQKSADNSFAEVSWGQGATIERTSPRPLTLIEALTDIYEVVVVRTGRVSRNSLLADFAQLGGRIVLVVEHKAELPEALDVRQRLIDAGLSPVEVTALANAAAA